MLTKEQARKLTERALSFSTFPECEISVNSSENAFIRFALNDVTTSGFTVEQAMSISSIRDGRTGSTRVDEFDDDALREAVRRTERLAGISPANPERQAAPRSAEVSGNRELRRRHRRRAQPGDDSAHSGHRGGSQERTAPWPPGFSSARRKPRRSLISREISVMGG